MKKTVCIIGKPNTGKSSLFNRLIKEDRAIIMDEPGVTKDRIYATVNYNNKSFSLIDTGGLDLGHDNFNEDILIQATFAIEESDLVLFVVDGKEPLTASDYKVRDLLRKSNKEVYLIVNKIDNEKRKEDIYNYYELGYEHIFAISTTHKLGIKELLDAITKDLKEDLKEENNICKFCFIGRPNVGKSSLINALLNKQRAIVSSIAGTTTDATDTTFMYHEKPYIMIDTAGIRKKGRIYENIEKYSLLRSLKAIERSDVCVLVLDATTSISQQDKHIAGLAINQQKALVICVNKIDTLENKEKEMKKWQDLIKAEFQFIPYVKVVFTSATTKKRIHLLMPEIIEAYTNHQKEIKTSLLNDCINEAYQLHEPPSYKGRRLKIYFVSQTATKPPKFTFKVNDKGLVHFSYQRYIENKIRESFDLTGTPIIIQFKNKSE